MAIRPVGGVGGVTWEEANAQAADHTGFGSNTSRQASLAEAMALYAANFGGDSEIGNTVGAVQPMTNQSMINDYSAAEGNMPDGWDTADWWTAAPTPSGHADLYLGGYGYVEDAPNTQIRYVFTAVL